MSKYITRQDHFPEPPQGSRASKVTGKVMNFITGRRSPSRDVYHTPDQQGTFNSYNPPQTYVVAPNPMPQRHCDSRSGHFHNSEHGSRKEHRMLRRKDAPSRSSDARSQSFSYREHQAAPALPKRQNLRDDTERRQNVRVNDLDAHTKTQEYSWEERRIRDTEVPKHLETCFMPPRQDAPAELPATEFGSSLNAVIRNIGDDSQNTDSDMFLTHLSAETGTVREHIGAEPKQRLDAHLQAAQPEIASTQKDIHSKLQELRNRNDEAAATQQQRHVHEMAEQRKTMTKEWQTRVDDVEAKYQRLHKAFEKSEQNYNAALRAVKTEAKTKLDQLQSTYEQSQQLNATILRTAETEAETMRHQHTTDLRTQKQSMEDDYRHAISSEHQRHKKELWEEKEALQQSHHRAFADQQQKYQKLLWEEKAKFEESNKLELSTQEIRFIEEKNTLINAHREQTQKHEREVRDERALHKREMDEQQAILQSIEAQHGREIEDERQLHDVYKREQREKLEEFREQHSFEVEAERVEHEKSITVLKNLHSEEMTLQLQSLENETRRLQQTLATIERKHRDNTADLRQAYETLKVQTVKRDQFRGLKDRDLRGRFEMLVDEVNTISNIEWSRQLEGFWPLEERVLERIKPKTRLLKKQMIQDSLWRVLRDLVFETPFRILGEDGEQLVSSWIETNTHGPTNAQSWTQGMDSEKQRREIASRLHTNMRSFGDSSVEGDGQLPTTFDYERSVQSAIRKICDTLRRVADVDNGDTYLKRVENLVRSCGKAWMEFGSQPYRVVIVMPEADGDLFVSTYSEAGTMELITRPGLKRYGDSRGENIAKGELLADASTVSYAYRGNFL